MGFHAPISLRIRSAIRANADDFYITGIAVVTIFFIAAALFPLLPNYPVLGKLAITFVLMIMPAMQCVVELMNNSVTAIFDPEALPKMDFSERIPGDCATLVVVPTLLLSERQVRDLVNEMEVRFLANRDPNLHFALVSDLPDSVNKPHDNDSSPLVSLALQLIKDLNARYNAPGHGGFLLLHRHRIFNVRQGVWMGWERKRGKLLDLNKLLVGEYDAFPIKAGRLEALRKVRYILTLDSDTQLPRGSAARMIGAIAHPLNQAIIDPKLRIVVEGYGILQPRVGVSVSSASRSRLAAIYSGQSGFDIYTQAISDAYQDLYGEGSFTGKGIYEVPVLHAVLNRRFPRNSLLSHDLIEGAYARAGLASDIEVIDDYPSHYSAYTRRKHRWVRGDWQIAQWMFSHVPDESNRMAPNPISEVSRWKIFDNLRRSLVEPFTFILFVAGWLWLPGGPLYWTIVPLAPAHLPHHPAVRIRRSAAPWPAIAKAPWPGPGRLGQRGPGGSAQSRLPSPPGPAGSRCRHSLAHPPLHHRRAFAGMGNRRGIGTPGEQGDRGRPLPDPCALHRLRPGHPALLRLPPSHRVAGFLAHSASLVPGHCSHRLAESSSAAGAQAQRAGPPSAPPSRPAHLALLPRIRNRPSQFPYSRQRGGTGKNRGRARLAHQHRLAPECAPGRRRIRIPHPA